MKKLFYSMMLVAAMFAASCNPEEETKVPEEPEYYGITLDHATVTNLGDFGKNGATQFFIQMYTLDEYNGYTRLMTAHFEVADKIEGDVIPEGTFALMEGDYVDDSYFAGSWYMYLKGNTAPYTMVSDGEIKIEKTEEGYTFTVEADGWDYYTGDEAEKVECRYIGAIDKVENNRRYNPDIAQAVYQGIPASTGVPYWTVQLDEQGSNNSYYYITQLYINTNNTSYEEGIPSGRYDIGDSQQPFSIDMSYMVGDTWWGSVVFKESFDEDGAAFFEPDNIMIGGYCNLINNGDGTYDIELVFYNGSYIPYVVNYSGEIATIDNSQQKEYNKEFSLNYYGNNKWCVIYSDEEDGLHTLLYCYSAEDTTWEGGLSSGTYTVDAEAGIPWENLASGPAFTIKPGVGEGNKYKGTGSYFADYWNWSIGDIISYGTMKVDNRGDNLYDVEIKVGGALGYFYVEYEYSGQATLHNASGAAAAPLKTAGFEPELRNYTKHSSFKYNGPTLRR